MVALAAGALSADTLLWVTGSQILATRTTRWVEEAQAGGWTVIAGERSTGGWPWAAALVIDRAGIAGGEHLVPGGLTWSADRVVVSVSLFHPLTLGIAAEGQQFVRLSNLQDVGFTAAQAIVRLPMTGRNRQASLLATGIEGGVAGSRHPQDVQLGGLSLLVRQLAVLPRSAGPAVPVLRIELQANGIGLPDIGRWPLGATVAAAGAALTLSSPALPDRQGANSQARAAAWRDGGGRLLVDDAALRWGPLAVTVRGALGLDGRLQLSGAGTADIVGANPALDAGAHAGLIPPGVAMTAQAVLAVMGRAPGPGGADAVRLPFRLHDSTLSVGEIPLARVPALAWHGGPVTPEPGGHP